MGVAGEKRQVLRRVTEEQLEGDVEAFRGCHNVLFLDLGAGYLGVFVWKSLSYTFMICVLFCVHVIL